MGIVHADITIENPSAAVQNKPRGRRNIRKLRVKALVDSGSVFMTVPEHVALQLGYDVEEVGTREAVLADGSRKRVPMIGPLRVHFQDRYCDLSALVLGDEALLGAVPMEMMDLVIHPAGRTLSVNPDNPYVPTATTKRGARGKLPRRR